MVSGIDIPIVFKKSKIQIVIKYTTVDLYSKLLRHDMSEWIQENFEINQFSHKIRKNRQKKLPLVYVPS